MNIPIQILKRSFQLILADPGQTLKVVLPGVIVIAIASAIFLGGVVGSTVPDSTVDINTLNVPLFIIGLLLAAVGWMVFAVLWHRYALLQEDARAGIMRPSVAIYRQYLKGAFAIGLVIFVLALVAGFALSILTVIASTIVGGSAFVVAWTLGLILTVLLSWVLLRVSLILPAASVGHEMSYSDSLTATKPAQRDFFWLAVALGVLSYVVEMVATGMILILPSIALLIFVAQVLINGLVYLSVLSTLYGHYIEGRPLK